MILVLLATVVGITAGSNDSLTVADTITVIPPGDPGFELEVYLPADSSQALLPQPDAPLAPPEPTWIQRPTDPVILNVTPSVVLSHPSPPEPPRRKK